MKQKKDDCNECGRKGVLKCMEEAEEYLPEDVSGFGAHDDYVRGLVDGARAAIQGVRSEIEKLHNEALEFGIAKE